MMRRDLPTIPNGVPAPVCAPPVLLVRFPGTSPLPLTSFLASLGYAVYERMAEVPPALYGAGAGSNYQAQGLKLSKHFV